MRNHSVVDHVAGQVTVDLNITGSNSFDLAKKEVEDGVVPPGKPSLVQGNWAEVDDVRQCAIGAGAEWTGCHHSFPPSPQVVRRGKGIGGGTHDWIGLECCQFCSFVCFCVF